jgi:abequosyltransferase
MNQPLLSICIATYNRAKFIGETLESIISQITNEVEIVIVDGASTDETRHIIEQYLNKCDQIVYFQLPTKGGVDQDYCKAVQFASGKMCWLFTDDDLLYPTALSVILESVRKEYSLILVNAQVMNVDFSKELKSRLLPLQNDLILPEMELDTLFDLSINFMSFIGCVVINRDLWMNREWFQYFGTEFIHIGVIFQSPLPSKTLLISDPQIKIRYGNALWSKRAFEIGLVKWPNLLNSFHHVSLIKKNKHNLSSFRHKFQSIIFYRALGSFTIREHTKFVRRSDFSLIIKFLLFFISIVPCSLLNFILLIYFKRFRKSNMVAIYDLENNRNNFFYRYK